MRFSGICLALTLLAGAAQADALDAFMERCLTPLENVAAPQLDGLIDRDPEDGFLVWQGREGWKLRTANGLDTPELCMISEFEWTDEIDSRIMAWMDDALAEGRYEVLPKVSLQSPTVLRSVHWREPRIELVVQRFSPEHGAFMMVRETDLEA